MSRVPPSRIVALVTLAGAFALGGVPRAVANPAPAPPDSTRGLPFEAVRKPTDVFAASKLNKTYGKDLSRLLKPVSPQSQADLVVLDRWGDGPDVRAPAEIDSSDIRLTGERPQGQELTPEEKKALEPPAAGVRASIPSSVATSATLIGGIALLVKVLVEMFK